MGRSRHLVTSVAILLLAAAPSFAQSVDEIVAKNLQAKGGLDLLRQTTAVKMTGTFKAIRPSDDRAGKPTETTLKMTSWARRPNLRRQQIEPLQPSTTPAVDSPASPPPAMRMVEATDGTTTWIQQGLAMPRALSAAQVAARPPDNEFDGVFIDYQSKGVLITNLGVEKLADRDVYHLTVQRKTGPLQHYFLDTQTGLETKVATDVSQGGAMSQGGPTVRVETEMSDYRAIEGRTVPFKLRQSVNGQVTAEMTIQTVEFNGEMPDSIFKLPR